MEKEASREIREIGVKYGYLNQNACINGFIGITNGMLATLVLCVNQFVLLPKYVPLV